MVKRPRQVMRYSPSAGKHTLHTVERVKKRRASELRWGQRRFRRVMAGYRGFPRPKPDGREKPTKRVNILYRCTETGKAHYAPCKRAKKFELVDRLGVSNDQPFPPSELPRLRKRIHHFLPCHHLHRLRRVQRNADKARRWQG